jgi:RsiW-degrading membrane proteinase PrsW (M82 family)
MSTAASLPGAQIKRGGFRRLWRTLKQLFHEVVGAIFAVLAFAWVNAAIRAWSGDAAYWLVAIAALVGALFLFFAVTSFQRARKI